MPTIHPSALVSPKAELAADVQVGPYAVIGAGVRIGPGTVIGSHTVIEGETTIGDDNRIHGFCSLGGPPQDKKYRGERTRLEIGDRNTIREFCTFNTGTAQDRGTTSVGNDNWIMAYVHIAHDCEVGHHTIFANNAQLAGHVRVGDWAILGGFTVVHQFVRIGAHSLTAMGTILLQDLPPYVTAGGNPAQAHGLNSEGLRRRGFDAAALGGLRRAYKVLYRSGRTLEDAKRELADAARDVPELLPLVDFLARSGRGIVR
ncbi:MAG: acyl-[acyl-carrier-protein]--UDP-N-acetylglucosamine O-acyltransferase [Betaproteobacteria bacterium]|nr:acyl-ACP--UDP-N-acetylglucosamine O-acyltransferase [Rhodocyclaceae bacterium]MCG3188043.1 Acyl-[acyl-carrier-protein]--UDP-N-acetylglucosamine O-acyltransferase [Rhodocyclaceae bacterium]